MRKKLHRIFSAFMALLLLASTISWTVEKHYCMGHLMDMSFFAEAEDCGMIMPSSENSSTAITDDDSCCKDERIVVEGQDDLQLSFENVTVEQQLFLLAFTYSYFNLVEISSERPLLNEYYPPPLLIKDIQLLDEVFLI